MGRAGRKSAASDRSYGFCTSGRNARGVSGADLLKGVAVGEAVRIELDVGVDVGGLLPGEGVKVAGGEVDVAVAEGVLALDVGVNVRVGVGDGSVPLNGVSVTYTGPAGEPPNRRTPGLPPLAASMIVVPLPSSKR